MYDLESSPITTTRNMAIKAMMTILMIDQLDEKETKRKRRVDNAERSVPTEIYITSSSSVEERISTTATNKKKDERNEMNQKRKASDNERSNHVDEKNNQKKRGRNDKV